MTDATPVPPPAAQPAPTPGARVTAPPGVDFPGKTLGIVGLILVFFTAVIGLIVSIVANSQSKAAGYANTPAKIGIILGIVVTILGIIAGIIAIVFAIGAASAVVEACQQLGEGIHVVDGITYTCG